MKRYITLCMAILALMCVFFTFGCSAENPKEESEEASETDVTPTDVLYIPDVHIDGIVLPEEYGEGLYDSAAALWLINEVRDREGLPPFIIGDEKLEDASAPATNPSEDAADNGNKVSTTVPESADLGKSSTTPAKGTAKEMDWWTSDIQQIFARGTTATITDVATGIAWKEMRKGGTNHADVQPLTAADTAAMKAAVGKWSWDRRAIFVTINGVNYAASMNCKPHGSGSITNNNFDGHHCIYFTNSRGHSSNKICSLHQAAIKKALAAKL